MPVFSSKEPKQQAKILELLKVNGGMTESMIKEALGVGKVYGLLQALIKKGCIEAKEDLNPRFGEKYQQSILKVYRFVKPLEERSNKAVKIEKAVLFLQQHGYKVVKE